MPTHLRQRRRRLPLTALVVAPVLALVSGCGGDAQARGGRTRARRRAADDVPDGTKIVVGDPATQVALKLSGQLDKVSKFVQFANLSGGPQTTEAFRAHALDVGSVAEIPPIHATWTGLHVKIVAAKFRQDPLNHPIYELGIAPGVEVKTLADLRGKKIAYSPGQAQGALVLKVLKKAGLTKDDVKLVELPSTGDVYSNALAAQAGRRRADRRRPDQALPGQVRQGRRHHDPARPPRRPGHLYAPTESLEDPAKAAAIRAYVAAWGVAQHWIDEHPKEWIEGYYVEGPGPHRRRRPVAGRQRRHPDISADWTDAIARQQETIELLAKETGNKVIQAADLYDLRFQSVGGRRDQGGPRNDRDRTTLPRARASDPRPAVDDRPHAPAPARAGQADQVRRRRSDPSLLLVICGHRLGHRLLDPRVLSAPVDRGHHGRRPDRRRPAPVEPADVGPAGRCSDSLLGIVARRRARAARPA